MPLNDLSTSEPTNVIGDSADLTQFYQIFFEEASENLDLMEQLILNLDVESPEDEDLNGIFRCAHSLKGGAATFGFPDVARLAHQMEHPLDKLRRHELKPNAVMVDVLLEAADAARALLARHQAGDPGQAPSNVDLVRRINESAVGIAPARSVQPGLTDTVSAVHAFGLRHLEISIGPMERPADADAIKELFRDIAGLGEIEVLPSDKADTRIFKVSSSSSNEDLLDLFALHVARELVVIRDFESGEFASQVASGAYAVASEAATIRVAIHKLDQLMSLVAELKGTQTMLEKYGQALDPGVHAHLLTALDDLTRNTLDLQESVMSIRMIPMSFVLSRFPRMIREMASKSGKKVALVALGEATELDKGLIEKISDPLMHLVRNSCDHGIELPEERLAKGKPETGTITLTTAYQDGAVVIEVRDDGRGLSRAKILSKARERGIEVPDRMKDGDVWKMIFAPGFSTLEVVTDVSGRGVGMDVVMNNITALNGTVDIESTEGQGMSVSFRVPLSVTVMEGLTSPGSDDMFQPSD